MSTIFRSIISASLVAFAQTACGADSGNDASVADNADALSGNPKAVNIGFNGGADQFAYYDDFFAVSQHAGPRLCHTYVVWNVAEQPAGMGNAQSHGGSRAYLEYWLHEAIGHCDEALVSFQAHAPGKAPTVTEFARAFAAFVTTSWARQTGFTGTFSFTPWNEPNNGASSGDGLGAAIPPDLAAAYYLSAVRACEAHGCKVAAGDFASNGGMWNDFEWNCANDNVDPQSLCRTKSSANPGGKPASYLDRYKNYIANHAHEYGLGNGFRPKYFAFHGWHDINGYLDSGEHCVDYAHCATRRILTSFGGSWGGVELWDTEVGVDQDRAAISDEEQACGAAFLLRLTTISRRVTRLYYTRIHNGTGELLRGHTPRPAMFVLAHRDSAAPRGCR